MHLERTVPDGISATRVDLLADALDLPVTRSQLRRRLRSVAVNGVPAKPKTLVAAGDRIEIELEAEERHDVVPEDVAFGVVDETDRYLVIDKPQGLVVHPGAGNWSGTLLHGLAWRYGLATLPDAGTADEWGDAPDESDADDLTDHDAVSDATPPRLGIVHRLDRDTSGVMIVARDAVMHAWLVAQFGGRLVEKRYLAIVKGRPRQSRGYVYGAIARDPRNRLRQAVVGAVAMGDEVAARRHLGQPVREGRVAATGYRVLRTVGGLSLVLVAPVTGRTHQIRVHFQAIGCPVYGDPLYARPAAPDREATLMLHARSLRLELPDGGGFREWVAPVPERFRECLRRADPVRYGDSPSR